MIIREEIGHKVEKEIMVGIEETMIIEGLDRIILEEDSEVTLGMIIDKVIIDRTIIEASMETGM